MQRPDEQTVTITIITTYSFVVRQAPIKYDDDHHDDDDTRRHHAADPCHSRADGGDAVDGDVRLFGGVRRRGGQSEPTGHVLGRQGRLARGAELSARLSAGRSDTVRAAVVQGCEFFWLLVGVQADKC